MARGRMPKGLRDAGAYAIGYTAQTTAYLLLVTDRYPNADPTEMLVSHRPPAAPPGARRGRSVRPAPLAGHRLLPDAARDSAHRLALLWGIAVLLAAIGQWFVTLVAVNARGRLHRFISTYIRYRLHVAAFLLLAANPFPGFTGAPGTYPLDLEVRRAGAAEPLEDAFRILLPIPALLVNVALCSALVAARVLTWFYALVKGSAPGACGTSRPTRCATTRRRTHTGSS